MKARALNSETPPWDTPESLKGLVFLHLLVGPGSPWLRRPQAALRSL